VLIGSVPSEVATRAACAVAAVPLAAALAGSGPVVAGYDGSDHSLRAARHAAAIAAQMDRDVVLVHAAGDRDGGVRADERPLGLKVSVVVEEGDPVETLVRVCRERAAPFVVTGTRGRNALSSALLGSVSVGLVRAAGRPVVLVPASAVDTPR
jgi:nucleotide-binding universal stress UspA family protein